jgi:hypothetical protein
MNVETLRQLDQGLLALDRGYRHFRLECRAMIPARSSCHGLLLTCSIMPLLRGKSTYPGCSNSRNHLSFLPRSRTAGQQTALPLRRERASEEKPTEMQARRNGGFFRASAAGSRRSRFCE